jgi:hypothetical protein
MTTGKQQDALIDVTYVESVLASLAIFGCPVGCLPSARAAGCNCPGAPEGDGEDADR